jgi:cytochrome b561
MRIFRGTLEYLSERQPPAVRTLHIVILLLVISQIIVSNFMGFTETGEVSRKVVEAYGTWIHIGTGLFLLPIAAAFIVIEIRRHGLKYFFPYLYGEFSQLKDDLQHLKRFKQPEPEAHGLAAMVEGLGLGALALVLLSGFAWFLSWLYMPSWAHSAKEVHEVLTGLIEAYVVGHGGMGLLHLFSHLKNNHPR